MSGVVYTISSYCVLAYPFQQCGKSYSEFSGQSGKNGFSVERLFVVPLIVEPLDDARLELLVDLAELHVAFDAVQLLLKLGTLSVHVRYHTANLTVMHRDKYLHCI